MATLFGKKKIMQKCLLNHSFNCSTNYFIVFDWHSFEHYRPQKSVIKERVKSNNFLKVWFIVVRVFFDIMNHWINATCHCHHHPRDEKKVIWSLKMPSPPPCTLSRLRSSICFQRIIVHRAVAFFGEEHFPMFLVNI